MNRLGQLKFSLSGLVLWQDGGDRPGDLLQVAGMTLQLRDIARAQPGGDIGDRLGGGFLVVDDLLGPFFQFDEQIFKFVLNEGELFYDR